MAFENKIHINCIGGLTTFLGSFLTFGTGIASLLPSKSSTMKLNLIPTKKLALLSAAFCAAMLAFSHNASAVTFLTLGNDFAALVGIVFAAIDAGKTAFVNHMIGMVPLFRVIASRLRQQFFVRRSNNNHNPPRTCRNWSLWYGFNYNYWQRHILIPACDILLPSHRA